MIRLLPRFSRIVTLAHAATGAGVMLLLLAAGGTWLESAATTSALMAFYEFGWQFGYKKQYRGAAVPHIADFLERTAVWIPAALALSNSASLAAVTAAAWFVAWRLTR